MQHAGTGTVISEVRRLGIWILRTKKTVSSVIRKCRKCSRFLAGPASEQTPPFPRFRVTCRRPFEATGMDLGGPLYLKDSCKAWFVVFTCMSVRAIHLEIVTSLSVEALIQAGLAEIYEQTRCSTDTCKVKAIIKLFTMK